MRDYDSIQAVICASVSNQDGRTLGITLPIVDAQEALIRHVYEPAGPSTLETEFVKARGTGTPAGDPIETESFAANLGPAVPKSQPFRIGSIEPNVGHMTGVSGIGGVIKAA